MYQSSFGFQLRPFSASPRHDWFFESESAQQIYQSIVSCVERAAGPAMLIGAPGTGKSLICQLIANNLRATFSVVVLDSARLCTRRAFLQNILFELGLPFRGLEEGELRLSLMDYLQPSATCPNGLLLLVDEAHVLPMRLLEELRMITNLVRNGQPRVRLVLAGNRTLEERFAHPKLESFNQRIAARCYLKPMNRAETAAYVGFQLEKAGGSQCRQVIGEDAIQTIYEVTEGLPRLINQVCDHALLLAAADGKKIVAPSTIAAAWSDIQQLPTPWYASGADEREGPAAIEFGELDATEPIAAAENADALDKAATETDEEIMSAVQETAEDAAQQELDADSGELESDDPLQTLDHISNAVGDQISNAVGNASLPLVGATDSAAEPSSHSSKPAVSIHSQAESGEGVLAEQEPEFAFDGPSDPFAEEFASEETVVDPFPAEQLAAARLAAAAAMESDVELVEEFEEDAHELIAGQPQLGESPQRQVPGDNTETGKGAVTTPAVQESTVADEQESVQDQARISRTPTVTVTVDKSTGRSTFTIGSSKKTAAATDSVAVNAIKGDALHDVEQAPPAEKSSAANHHADMQDDRDMIVGIDEADSPLRVAADTQPDQTKKARAHRAEYQTLFSRMRNG